MNQLNVLNLNGQLLVDSREVAEMVSRQHNELMKSIRSYVKHLTKGDIPLSGFFIESTYQDSTGRTLPSYLLTKKGCDMVANKMTGEKGILFTAAYVTRFEEMENKLKSPRVLTEKEQLKASMKLSLETSEEVGILKNDVAKLQHQVTNKITLDHGEQQTLHHEIKKRIEGYSADKGINENGKRHLYSQIHSHLRRAFASPSYRVVKQKDFEESVAWVKSWRPLV
jgi:Rha family phage regulatory protein